MMHRAHQKTLITDLNQHLTCKLCNGYFIDATTIIECLHTFCRSCIVRYLQTNKYCPVCDVQVHKTKPLLNIRPDKTLQDIVYKLVPRLLQNELQRRREFYKAHPEYEIDAKSAIDQYSHIITTDESISLTLSYYGSCKDKSVRYLQCPAAVTCGHLQKLIRAKYGLLENHRVDILYNQDCLNSHLTLIDIAYMYSWKRKSPIELTFRIYESTKSKQIGHVQKNNNNNNNNTWKEVQLRISENGEMSITGIQEETAALELVNNNYKPENDEKEPNTTTTNKSDSVSTATTTSILKDIIPAVATTSVAQTKTVFSTTNSTKCSVTTESDQKGTKRKLEPLPISTPSDEIKKARNTEPLEVFQKPNFINKQFTNPNLNRPGTPITKPPASKPCYMPKPVINVPKPSTSCTPTKKSNDLSKASPIPVANKLIKSKASTPIGYKTLRDPPKSWNSQISKAKPVAVSTPSVTTADGGNKTIDGKSSPNVKPAKFFKMRNNIPRYLGNPASGVKPMYQLHGSPEKDNKQKQKNNLGEIKKHSIVKIDPKTLKPISEKAPETTSLSTAAAATTSNDLKINTSSVSIFNPLKLQNSSPKGERKSPKSPSSSQSPKTNKIGTVQVAPPPPLMTAAVAATKRDKLNLNFTPSNPFIPNLTSPTMSPPNQFLYPTTVGPPGFPPPYDPRVMAAYHNFFYGQRMAFPGGLSLDLNPRKNFELPAPTSPKLGGLPQPHSPQASALKLPPQSSNNSSNSNNNNNNVLGSSTKSLATKKTSKDVAMNKNSEKSLQNTVEKLTQNRVKEIKNAAEAASQAQINKVNITTDDGNRKIDDKKTTTECSNNSSTSNNNSGGSSSSNSSNSSTSKNNISNSNEISNKDNQKLDKVDEKVKKLISDDSKENKENGSKKVVVVVDDQDKKDAKSDEVKKEQSQPEQKLTVSEDNDLNKKLNDQQTTTTTTIKENKEEK